MGTTQEVTFGGVHVRGAWASADSEVTVEATTYTPTGQARVAVLTERELINLAEQVAVAQRQLFVHRMAIAMRDKKPLP